MKLFISPRYGGVDKGTDGGIRRVVEAQRTLLPALGAEFTDNVEEAEVVGIHAGAAVNVRVDQAVVAMCHGLYWNKYSWQPWHYELNKQVIDVLRTCTLSTAPTEWVANTIRRQMYMGCQVIPHGVDCERWQEPTGPHQNYVLWNKTRVDPVCDPTPVNELAQRLPRVEFKSTFGYPTSNVDIVGITAHDNMSYLVQNAGVYLCTAQETFGIGTLEAMACGVPVVGWDWGGQSEIVRHQIDGFLARPGDYAQLTEGILWAMSNREQLSAAARARAEEYTWERACQAYMQVFQEALLSNTYKKRVSIIIPSYNLGKYLPETIVSAKDQLPPEELEVIVVDDCSTDLSLAIANSLASDTVKVLRTDKNKHLAGAMNYGIERARGRYILALDADNILPPNSVRLLADMLDNSRELDIAYGRIKFITEDGQVDATVSGDGISTWPPKTFSLDEQLSHHNQIPSGAMHRKTTWERIGGYRERARTGQDADFWCRATSIGCTPKHVTDAVTLIYRQRIDSMSRVEKDWPWEQWSNFNGKPPIGSTAQLPSVYSLEPTIVSVIIPVGPGHERLVMDALDSLYIQTFKNWEAIVVWDSPIIPDTRLLPAWARLLVTDTKGILGGAGPSRARNTGIAAARGALWCFLDADDYLDPFYLEKMLTAYKERGGYVYSDYRRVEDFVDVACPSSSCELLKEQFPHVITGLYPAGPYRFDEALTYAEDWDFVLQVTQEGACGTCVQEPLVYYRKTSGARRVQATENGILKSEYLAQIKAKWAGVDMACGCSKNVLKSISPNSLLEANQGTQSMVQDGDLVLLEYTGEDPKRSFAGKVTGRSYVFGSASNRIKFVHKDDVAAFLDRHDFKLHTGPGSMVLAGT